MREYLYRGFYKCDDGDKVIMVDGKQIKGKWVEGYYAKFRNIMNCVYSAIMPFDSKNEGETYLEDITYVIPETVCEYTGLTDKNGKKIFEGDILQGYQYPYLSGENFNYYAEVIYFDNCPAFGIYTFKNPNLNVVRGISAGNTDLMEDWESKNWEVIGNIFENPELLEVNK